MLSALSGTLAVLLVCRIGRRLFGPRAGLVAGALLAVSPLALQFSRLAGSGALTGTLWAAGFLFLFRALGARAWGDWAAAGLCFGLGFYFYPSGRLIVPVLVLAALYCFGRWRGRAGFLAPGWALLGATLLLCVLLQGVVSARDDWKAFLGRARETWIFSPEHRPLVFQAHGVAYDRAWASASAARSLLEHPLAWIRVVAGQLWLTLEALYRRGDPTAFYQIRVHGGTLSPKPARRLTSLAVHTGAGGTAPALEQPVDVAVGPDGAVYVVDLRSRVVGLDAEGRATRQWPVEIGLGRGGSHLAVCGGRVVLTDPDRGLLLSLDPEQGDIRRFAAPADAGAWMPVGVACGPGDRVYVVDSAAGRVLELGEPGP